MYILCIAISFLYHSHSEWYLTMKKAAKLLCGFSKNETYFSPACFFSQRRRAGRRKASSTPSLRRGKTRSAKASFPFPPSLHSQTISEISGSVNRRIAVSRRRAQRFSVTRAAFSQ